MFKLFICMFCLHSIQFHHTRILANKIFNSADPEPLFAELKTVCPTGSEKFDVYGCFSLDGPMKHLKQLPQKPEYIDTTFYGFTKGGSEFVIDPKNPETFEQISSNKRIVFLIHGFQQNYQTPLIEKNRLSLLQFANDIGTVILVDWSKGAMDSVKSRTNRVEWWFITTAHPEYVTAAANTQLVGRQITFLVQQLRYHADISETNVYLVGFSLGAHVAGFAGKWSQEQYNWKYDRITGLDAAQPGFEDYTEAHLKESDAVFVDAIHTNTHILGVFNALGFVKPYAQVDYYPAGGHAQPLCPNCFAKECVSCSHSAALHYYAASLDRGTCQLECCFEETDICDTVMGYYADQNPIATGRRYCDATGEYPFCEN